jgi:hypothetical protein
MWLDQTIVPIWLQKSLLAAELPQQQRTRLQEDMLKRATQQATIDVSFS